MSGLSTMALKASGLTHPGRVRTNNEDAFLADDGLYVVADGMGGHQGGEVASAVAVDTLREGRHRVRELADITTLVGEANAAILARAAQEPENLGMGTTLTGLMLVGDLDQPLTRLAVLNVGDSRTYRWRDGALEQITRDHSYVQDLVASGMLTAAEARHHPRRNIVTRALGVESVVVPDVVEVEVLPGDRFLVCSDGLVDEVPDVDIIEVMQHTQSGEELANALVQFALDCGGRDNVTVVIVDVVASEITPPSTWAAPVPAPAVLEAPVVRRRRRWLGATLLLIGVIAVVGGTLVAVGAYARSGYFVDFDTDGDTVVVYRGRPGGV
jgi:PPM family protein phosphatase